MTFLSWEGTAHPVGDRLMVQQTTRRVPLRGYYACRRDTLSGEIIPTKLTYPSVPISLLITPPLLTRPYGREPAASGNKLYCLFRQEVNCPLHDCCQLHRISPKVQHRKFFARFTPLKHR